MSPPMNSHYLLISDIGSGSLRNSKFNSPKALVHMRQQLVELFAGAFDLARLIKRQAGQASRTEVVLVTVPVCVNSAGQLARS